MRQSKVNNLLLELLIVVLFFSLVIGVAVRLFGAVRQVGRQADCTQEALFAGQELIEQLYVADDPNAALSQLPTGADWRLEASLERQETASGTLLSGEICGYMDEKALFALPFARYIQEARP